MNHDVPVREFTRPVTQCLDAQDPVWKAWRSMKANKAKRLPVKEYNRIVGIVSDRDIAHISGFNGGQSMAITEAMVPNPLMLSVNDSMIDAIKSMVKEEQQHAIVMDENSEVCGLFSWDSAFEYLVNQKGDGNDRYQER